jgi:glutathione reductase (NADPH)
MPKFDYDLFVIGGGSGGVRAARLAAQMGVKTAIAEEYRFGGTCVIRGCIPKKLLVYAGELGHAIDDAAGFGWTVEGKSFDWNRLIANKDREIARLSGLYRQAVEKAGGEIIESRAEIVDPHTIKLLKSRREVTAERILVATGGHPFIPPIPGREYAITSNEALDLDRLPGRIVIMGAGYIALEFAGIFNALGVEV